MYMDDVLREKYRSQRDIARGCDFSIERIVEEAEKETKRLARAYGIKLKTARLPATRADLRPRGRALKRAG